jgi:hypothetical protein
VTAGFSVSDAIALQREACARLGSPLYARVLDSVAADHAAGGLMAEMLEGRTTRPVHDALPLRLLGAVHRLVLESRAPDLARFYPSVGGTADGDPWPAFLATVLAHRAAVDAGLDKGVQTNEVGRAAALAPGFALVARRTGLPLRMREIGSSAGLLLHWDRFRYETGGVQLGDPRSQVVFDDAWADPVPDLSGPVTVEDRRGCDLAPIDPTSSAGRVTLLSFVWPDQAERFERLRRALDVAAAEPAVVDKADAGPWVEAQLADRAPSTATIVFHSAVLPYLTPPTRRRVRAALHAAGSAADADSPLAWLRMEPADLQTADVRLTTWPGGEEEDLATTGFHGGDVHWLVFP